ncbi:DUF6713 family protein [Paenibacillus illinoisensis]
MLDIFFIIHTILHFRFEKHPRNPFKNSFSRSFIYPMGIFALIHLIFLIN